jgi:hypothetical protein
MPGGQAWFVTRANSAKRREIGFVIAFRVLGGKTAPPCCALDVFAMRPEIRFSAALLGGPPVKLFQHCGFFSLLFVLF